MATITSLRGHLVQELHDLLNAEQQLIDALPKLVQQSSSKSLKGAFQRHLAQTRMHERRITQALEALGEAEASHTSEAMEGLIKEGDELMSSGEPGALMDAMLITAAQKVEHYEMATYGTVRTYAAVLGERQVTRLLEQTLKEEKAANKKLTAIAEASVNARAAKEWHERSGASGLLQKGAEWIGSAVGDAMTRVESRRHLGSRVHGRSCRGRTGNHKLRVGDRVVVPFTIACGRCFFCQRQLWAACDNSNPNAAMVEALYGYSGSGLFGYSAELTCRDGFRPVTISVPSTMRTKGI